MKQIRLRRRVVAVEVNMHHAHAELEQRLGDEVVAVGVEVIGLGGHHRDAVLLRQLQQGLDALLVGGVLLAADVIKAAVLGEPAQAAAHEEVLYALLAQAVFNAVAIEPLGGGRVRVGAHVHHQRDGARLEPRHQLGHGQVGMPDGVYRVKPRVAFLRSGIVSG